MSLENLVEATGGLLLLFFVPGYALTRALFPEWRLTGPGGLRRLLETLTLSFLLSVVLTVLIGYLLLSEAPGGFRASWSDPVLELCLIGTAGVAFVAAFVRGAFSAVPPRPTVRESQGSEEGAWELTLELDRLGREERTIVRALRAPNGKPGEQRTLEARLREIQERRSDLGRQREAEYAH